MIDMITSIIQHKKVRLSLHPLIGRDDQDDQRSDSASVREEKMEKQRVCAS